jgi:hypothetical protein
MPVAFKTRLSCGRAAERGARVVQRVARGIDHERARQVAAARGERLVGEQLVDGGKAAERGNGHAGEASRADGDWRCP